MAYLANYEEIVADIKDKFERRSEGFGSTTDSSIRKWITQLEAEIYSVKPWAFLRKVGTITTSAATTDGEYSLADDYDFGSLFSVYDTTNKKYLMPIDISDIDAINTGLTSTTGTPDYYFLWGVDTNNVQEISFYPIPAGTYTIKYRYKRNATPVDIETDTSNDTEQPILPRKYRRLLVDAVLEELMQRDTNPNADRVNAKYQYLLNLMIADFSRNPYRRDVMGSLDASRGNDFPARLPNTYPKL